MKIKIEVIQIIRVLSLHHKETFRVDSFLPKCLKSIEQVQIVDRSVVIDKGYRQTEREREREKERKDRVHQCNARSKEIAGPLKLVNDLCLAF